MQRHIWLITACLLTGMTPAFASVLSTQAHAEDDLRCQGKIVSLGLSLYDVQALCGPPDFADRRTVRRAVQNRVRNRCVPGLGCSSSTTDSVEVVIDEWTYDFGKHRLLRYLTFADGRLISVRTGGYGHKVQ